MSTIEKPFYLEKPHKGIFVGLECREHPDLNMVYGFIHANMGIKLGKKHARMYGDEMTHYRNYLRNIKYDDEDRAHIATTYKLQRHGWGRVQANASLSLSLFHRPTRHALCKENYYDFDMSNAQPQFFMELCRKAGIEVDGLRRYCANPKARRQEIADFYHLENFRDDNGVLLTAIEQAKKLPIRLMFGGGTERWKAEVGCKMKNDMPLIVTMKSDIEKIMKRVLIESPTILEDLEMNPSDEWNEKSKHEKESSVMAAFAQTWERIIQEHCIAFVTRTFGEVHVQDIIPSQDGFMVLKSQLQGVDIEQLHRDFNDLIVRKYDMDVKWLKKPFDEAIEIPLSNTPIMDLYMEDLEKGETHVAKKISPCLRQCIKYSETFKVWYSIGKKNVWRLSSHIDLVMLTDMIQNSMSHIETEIKKQMAENTEGSFNAQKKKDKEQEEKEKKKREDLRKQYKAYLKHFVAVGKGSYTTQLSNLLKSYLRNDDFYLKLDRTAGKMVWADGILNLRTNTFTEGFRYDDYITVHLEHNYKDINPDKTKAAFLRSKLKQITNNNEEHLEYMLRAVGHSMTGDADKEKAIYYVKDGTERATGNNGKTFLFKRIQHVLPEFVIETDPVALEEKYSKAYKHILAWKNKRIIFTDEGTREKPNMRLIKKIGDGMQLEIEILYGTVEKIDLQAKLFICSNYEINMSSNDEGAGYNRFRQIQLNSHFDLSGTRVEEDESRLLFIGDKNLGELIDVEYKNEMLALIIDYATQYYQSGIPHPPSEFKEATELTKILNNPFATILYEKYEKGTEGDRIALEDVVDYMRAYKKQQIIKEMGILDFIFNKEMKGMGSKTDRDGKVTYKKGGFAYLKIKDTEEE